MEGIHHKNTGIWHVHDHVRATISHNQYIEYVQDIEHVRDIEHVQNIEHVEFSCNEVSFTK